MTDGQMIGPEDLFRREILGMRAYHVQPAAGMIKLDAMENPYDWPEEMVSQWLDCLKSSAPNRYPDPQASELVPLLRSTGGIPDDMAVLLGNGSDELIQMLLMAINAGSDSVMAPEPTFVMYRQLATILGIRFQGVPLHADNFELDMPAMEQAIQRHQPRLIFLAYPNNPTGNLFRRVDVERVLELAPGLVILDEAYTAFASDSFMRDLAHYPNLLVMRTLSKLGLAGLRLGLLCGDARWLEQLEKLRLPYNINTLSQVTARFALQHADVFAQQTRAICRDRDQLAVALQQKPGLTVFPSEANFITFRSNVITAGEVFEQLKQRKVLIKNLDPNGGSLAGCLRVTIGTPGENSAFLQALDEILG